MHFNFFRQKSKKLTVGGQKFFIVISFTWKIFFHVTKFLWQEKSYFEGPTGRKYAKGLETFLSKSERNFEKKVLKEIFSLRKSSGHVEERFSDRYIVFSKVQTLSLKIRIDLWKKKQENNFFLEIVFRNIG